MVLEFVAFLGIAKSIILIGAVISAFAAGWQWIIRPIGRMVITVSKSYDRLEDVAKRLEAVEQQTKQLTNNGGSHMKDVVERTEIKLDFHLEECRTTHADIREEILSLATKHSSRRQ